MNRIRALTAATLWLRRLFLDGMSHSMLDGIETDSVYEALTGLEAILKEESSARPKLDFAEINRERKARKLALTLFRQRVTSGMVSQFGREQWAIVAKLAGVPAPDTSIPLAMSYLHEMENQVVALAAARSVFYGDDAPIQSLIYCSSCGLGPVPVGVCCDGRRFCGICGLEHDGQERDGERCRKCSGPQLVKCSTTERGEV